MTECINKCTPYEYENSLSPTPVESDLVQVYDSIEQITNPNSNHIYVVGNDIYVFDGTRFLHTNECNIPPYTGEYNVTAPSEGDLVLPTKDKLMEDNVTVSANHEIEDALLTGNFTNDVYYNDRVTRIRMNAFYGFDARVINLPNLSFNVNEVGQGLAYTLAEEIYTPRLFGKGYNSFYRFNENLRVLDIGLTAITSLFANCPKLEVLIIRKPTMQTISNVLEDGAPLSKNGVGGYVYVPQALISEYQSDTGWQTNAHVLAFRPIEGSEYELEE